MNGIQANSSLQPEPAAQAGVEYAEIPMLPNDGEDPHKKKQRRKSNEHEPLYPPNKEAKGSGEAAEAVYAMPFQKHDKHPITGGQNFESPKSDEYAVPMPEQFKGYSDDELELLVTALNKTLKERQGGGERHEGMSRKPYHRDDSKLETIFEDDPVSRTDAGSLPPAADEVPPPIPAKKRKQRVGTVQTEQKIGEG